MAIGVQSRQAWVGFPYTENLNGAQGAPMPNAFRLLSFGARAKINPGVNPGGPSPTVPDDTELLDAYSRTVAGTIERASPAVAHIAVSGEREGRRSQGTGSGVVVSPDGIVLTNNHYHLLLLMYMNLLL